MSRMVMVLMLAFIGARASSRPSEPDRAQLIESATIALAAAADGLRAAEADARSRAVSSHEYATAISQLQAAKKAAAGDHSTREDRSKATAAVAQAETAIHDAQEQFVEHDAAVRASAAKWSKAANDLDKLKWVDLLDCVEPARDAVRGTWSFAKNALVANAREPVERATIHIPTEMPTAYELELTFHRAGQIGGPFVMLPVGDRCVMLELDRGESDGGRCSGLSKIGGTDASRNVTRTRGARVSAADLNILRIYSYTADGRANVTAILNGRPLVNWEGAVSDISPIEYFAFPNGRQIGLAAWSNRVAFESVKMRPLAGADDFHNRITAQR